MTRPVLRFPFGKKARRPELVAPPITTELSIPTHFRCPISLELMKDPVTLATGITYDRRSIETWFDNGHRTCPVTGMVVDSDEESITPNHSLRRMIQEWCVAHKSYGVERIPTPRAPVTLAEVAGVLSEIASACQNGDGTRCRTLVARIRSLAKESERNRRSIVSSGAARSLCASFNSLTTRSEDVTCIPAMEEILSMLTNLFPLDNEACLFISSQDSVTSIISILNSGNLASRLDALLVLKELAANSKDCISAITETEGVLEYIVKIIKEPVSPQATKACLITAFHLVSSSEQKITTRLVELGMVPLMIELLVDTDKSVTEKALAVLDGLLNTLTGISETLGNALATPVLVKKLLRVSDLATEFAVSALWKLCRSDSTEGESCIVEALQVGAFQKLLLLLQVGCGDATKEKATELLKLLNGFRGKLECIESMDFKGLKRPF